MHVTSNADRLLDCWSVTGLVVLKYARHDTAELANGCGRSGLGLIPVVKCVYLLLGSAGRGLLGGGPGQGGNLEPEGIVRAVVVRILAVRTGDVMVSELMSCLLLLLLRLR